MNSLRSLFTAPLKAFTEVKLLGVLLVTNLCTALVLSVPIIPTALSAFGHSLSGQGKPFPSSEAVFDFSKLLAQGGGAFIGGSMLLAVLLPFGQQLLFAGGIASRLCSTERFTLGEFARQCGRLLGRNLRLQLWSLLGFLPVVGIAVGAGAALSAAGKTTLFTLEGDQWVQDNPFDGWSVAHLALGLVLLSLWRASLDLARVQLYADDQRKTRVAFWRAFKRMVTSPGALLGYMGLGAIGLLAVIGLAHLHAAVQVTSAGKAWLALLVAQVVVLARLGFSMATTAFTVDIYRAMAPQIAKAPAVAPRPVAPPAAEPEAALAPVAEPPAAAAPAEPQTAAAPPGEAQASPAPPADAQAPATPSAEPQAPAAPATPPPSEAA